MNAEMFVLGRLTRMVEENYRLQYSLLLFFICPLNSFSTLIKYKRIAFQIRLLAKRIYYS